MKKTFLKNNKKRILAFLTSLSMMPIIAMPAFASATPSFEIPTTVTNVGLGAEMIKVTFDGPVDMDALEVKAVAQEAKGNVIANGREYSVGIVEKNEVDNSFSIDLAGLPSGVKFKLDVEGTLSDEFTTGLIANMPYVEDTAIIELIEPLNENVAIYPGVSTGNHSLKNWIDRNSATDFNFSPTAWPVSFPDDYVVIDLGKSYEIGDLAAELTGTMWHSAGTRFYLAEDLSGITYGSLTDGMQFEISNHDTAAPVFAGMIDHAVMSEPTNARYIILKENIVGSNKDFNLREVYAFTRVGDQFGNWSVVENYPNIEFSIPFTYVATPKTYTMAITTYGPGKVVQNHVETTVTGNLFEGEIPYYFDTTCAQAVIYDGEAHKIVAPVKYWNISGYAKDNGTADTFEDAVTGTPKNESFVVSGKSVEETDYITVSVVSAYEDKVNSTEYADAEVAFENEDIIWQASAASGNGYEIEVPLSGGKYFIRVIRYAKDGTEEFKYFSHKIIGAQQREAFIEAAMDGDAAVVETAVLDALEEEIITESSLADVEALEDENFYATYVSTRGMLYNSEEIAAIKEANEVGPVIGLLNAVVAVNYILNGDYEKAVGVIDKMSDSSLIDEYIITTATAESYNSIFAILKSEITDSETLGNILKWSGMLALLCGADADKAAALTDYEEELGIDLGILETKEVSLENVASHINTEITSENILNMYADFASVFEAAVEKEANMVRASVTLPTGNVTNVGRGIKMIEVSFSGPVDPSALTEKTVYAVAQETKGNIVTGTQYSVGLIKEDEDGKSYMVDIAGLPSNTKFKLVIDEILAERFESEVFTTGIVANIPYAEDTVILDVIEPLDENVAIYPGVPTTTAHTLKNWIDRNPSTDFNFNDNTDKFPNNFVVVDLGRNYEIGDIAGQISGTAWHSGSTRFYLAESLEGITYDTLTDGMSFTVANADTGTSIFDTMIDHAVMSEPKTARYVIVKRNASSAHDLILKELFAFARVSDSFGDWKVTENASNLKFEIPFTYAKVPKTYTMAITTYKADKTVQNQVVKTVTGDLFEATVSRDANTAFAQAVIYDGENHKILAPVKYWGFEGYNKDNGTALKFQDAVTATPKNSTLVLSGKSVADTDYITVNVVNAEDADTIVWQASTVSGAGYEIEVPFADTNKYLISVIRYAKDGTKEVENFSYKKAETVKLDTFIDDLTTGDAAAVKTAVETAIAEEIIDDSYLLDAGALDDEDFYAVYEYTRDMIYTAEEKAEIADGDKLEAVVDTLNAAVVINAIWNGDNESAKTLLKSDAAKLIEGLTEKVTDVESYSKVFVALKSEVESAEDLASVIDWSKMLAPMYGTDEDRSKNMQQYEKEFKIDLSVIGNKGLSIDRVSSYMNPSDDSDIVSMYNDFTSVFDTAVQNAEAEKEASGNGSGDVSNNGNSTGNDIYNSSTKPITSDRGSKGNGGGIVVAPTPAVKAPAFSDMAAYGWANDAVSKLVDNKVLNGYTDGTFRPENYVTRGEFIKMLVVATEVEVVENKSMFFLDVADDSWYFPYIKIAYTNGLCQGVSDGYFDPQGYITRQDMAVLIYNYMKFAKINSAGESKTFTDEAQIAGYAKDAVARASAAGVINGRDDGTFAPLANARRVDAAMMISKIMK